MNAISALAQHITELVEGDTQLTGYLPEDWFYLHQAESYPSLVLDGMIALDDKQDAYSFNLHLYSKGQQDTAGQLEFYSQADRIRALLRGSQAIVGGAWLDRPEPAEGVMGALFPCTAYLQNL